MPSYDSCGEGDKVNCDHLVLSLSSGGFDSNHVPARFSRRPFIYTLLPALMSSVPIFSGDDTICSSSLTKHLLEVFHDILRLLLYSVSYQFPFYLKTGTCPSTKMTTFLTLANQDNLSHGTQPPFRQTGQLLGKVPESQRLINPTL